MIEDKSYNLLSNFACDRRGYCIKFPGIVVNEMLK